MSIFHANSLIGSSGQSRGYSISRSLRFNSADSAYLSRTPASAGNRKTWTWAGWVKRSGLSGSDQFLFLCSTSNTSATTSWLSFNASEKLTFGISGFNRLISTQVFRDVSAWYHIVLAADTTQATASSRYTLYVNGNQITALDTADYVVQNTDTQINAANEHRIGRDFGSYTSYLSGYLADIHFIDGQALAPSSFGEFDTNGIWQPKAYTGSYGTNGFHLDFADNSAATATILGKDTSGNGNNWTPNNLYAKPAQSLPGVYFDGNGDYLDIAGASFNIRSAFTVEFYTNPRSTYNTAFFRSGNDNRFYIETYLGNGIYVGDGGSNIINVAAPPTNRWTHVAVSFDGTTYRIFYDGVLKGSSTSLLQNYTLTSFKVGIKYDGSTFERPLNGSISNLRVVGSCLYTAAFTPPSAPLSNVASTQLLCCQSSSSATASVVTPGTITGGGNATAGTFNDSSPNEDSLLDSPTNGTASSGGDAGGVVVGNYCTLNPLSATSGTTLTNGNLELTTTVVGGGNVYGTFNIPTSGKWYWEFTPTVNGNMSYCGITQPYGTKEVVYYSPATKYVDGVASSYGASYTTNDLIGVAVDSDNGQVTFYKNGVSQGAISYSLTSGVMAPSFADGTNSLATTFVVNFGARPFAYAAPSGFKSLNTANLPTPTILKGGDYFDTKLYTGNNNTNAITGLGFSPDFVWIKGRSSALNHILHDTVRGRGYGLYSNLTNAEPAVSAANTDLASFDSAGFTLGSNYNFNVNDSGVSFAAWCWDAGSSNSTNTAGSITSTVRANASAGFSIVTYTGNGTDPATIGHGLGVAPSLIIAKGRSNAFNWAVYHRSITASNFIYLNSTGAALGSSAMWNTDPTATVFSVGNQPQNNSSSVTYVAYCFAPVAGYSSFGSYTGNGSSDGPFVYTGFRPKFVIVKGSSAVTDWWINDSVRSTYNQTANVLRPNDSTAEYTGSDFNSIDILSNGFKMRNTNSSSNANGSTYIYAAFSEVAFSIARAR